MAQPLSTFLVSGMEPSNNDTSHAQFLESVSPSEIIHSEVLLAAFHKLLDRCTKTERQRLLLPPNGQYQSVSFRKTKTSCVCGLSSRNAQRTEEREMRHNAATSADCVTLEPLTSLVGDMDSNGSPGSSSETTAPSPVWSPSSCSTSASTVPDILTVPDDSFHEAQEFFEKRLGPRFSHSKHLIRAARGFTEAIDLDPERYRNVWLAKTKIFLGSGKGPVARFQRLLKGLVRIKYGRDDYDCASRLCHIFLEHDLEQLVKTKTLQTSRGRGKKTAALYAHAESISSTVAAVKAHCKAGRCYLQLLRITSPGFLLLIGSHVNTVWERKLSKGDIPLLIQYLHKHHSRVIEKARSLDKIAARLIIDGFIAYGWTYSELETTRTKLLDQLRQYIDLSKLSEQEDDHEGPQDAEMLSPSTPEAATNQVDLGEGEIQWEQWSNSADLDVIMGMGRLQAASSNGSDTTSSCIAGPINSMPPDTHEILSATFESVYGAANGCDLPETHFTPPPLFEQLDFSPGLNLAEWFSEQIAGSHAEVQNGV